MLMRVAIVASNYNKIDKDTKKGTDIIVHAFINNLVRQKDLQVTAFASGDSDLPVKIESISSSPSVINKHVVGAGKHIIFELALLSNAFKQQDLFDLYHINIGDGDIALPFAPFVKKPILITLYHPTDMHYANEYFSLFKKNKNIFFVSPTNWQRKRLPFLPYAATIYHGIDTSIFQFDPKGGESIMWAGRAVPQKGMDVALEVAKQTKRELNLFGMPKNEYLEWFKDIVKRVDEVKTITPVSVVLNKHRLDLVEHFQKSKLFLFPIQWEEPFGLVMVEAMACGTPLVAFSRGSVPEIIKDGETGFIVNPSEHDIRGSWIIKKTGIEGLIEAVERIYALPESQYLEIRKKCRKHVEEFFSIDKMVKNYLEVYKSIIK